MSITAVAIRMQEGIGALMTTLPLRSIPGLVWPAIPDGRLSQVWALYLQLERTQWLESAAVVAGQLAQARTLLIHCAENVPYYQDLFRREGIHPEAIHS